jgi:hypothetical protein
MGMKILSILLLSVIMSSAAPTVNLFPYQIRIPASELQTLGNASGNTAPGAGDGWVWEGETKNFTLHFLVQETRNYGQMIFVAPSASFLFEQGMCWDDPNSCGFSLYRYTFTDTQRTRGLYHYEIINTGEYPGPINLQWIGFDPACIIFLPVVSNE